MFALFAAVLSLVVVPLFGRFGLLLLLFLTLVFILFPTFFPFFDRFLFLFLFTLLLLLVLFDFLFEIFAKKSVHAKSAKWLLIVLGFENFARQPIRIDHGVDVIFGPFLVVLDDPLEQIDHAIGMIGLGDELLAIRFQARDIVQDGRTQFPVLVRPVSGGNDCPIIFNQ